MPFEKGRSGNPDGRKAGKPNKTTSELRALLQAAFESEIENIPRVIESLPPKERIELLSKFLPYFVPKVIPQTEAKADGISLDEIHSFAAMIQSTTDPNFDANGFTLQVAREIVEHKRKGN